MRLVFFFSSVVLLLFFLFSNHKTKAEDEFEFEFEFDFEFEQLLNSTIRARKLATRCNIFRGKWVYDASYPLYDFSSCPFIDTEFNCLQYKRPDKSYLKFRWQPFSCNLPRFNGQFFLEKWRGKKIMFVGDSLSLNMWESLGCLLHSWVPKSRN